MIKDEKKYELIKFEDGEFSLDVNVSPDEDTVWLTANEIALLFERDEKTIRKHINNVFEENEVDYNNNTHFLRVVGVKQKVAFYSLNIIISVGYRVKSKRGVLFRQWANSILKQYLLNGHVINEDRCISCASNIISLENKVESIESKIPPLPGMMPPLSLKLHDLFITDSTRSPVMAARAVSTESKSIFNGEPVNMFLKKNQAIRPETIEPATPPIKPTMLLFGEHAIFPLVDFPIVIPKNHAIESHM